jgi:hypothetical protein
MRFIQNCQLALVLAACSLTTAAIAQPVKLGAATYYLSPRGKDKPPPAAPYRTEDHSGRFRDGAGHQAGGADGAA